MTTGLISLPAFPPTFKNVSAYHIDMTLDEINDICKPKAT